MILRNVARFRLGAPAIAWGIELTAMSLKLRLILLITTLLLLMMFLGAIHLIMNAREDVYAEIESTAVLLNHLIDAEIAYLAVSASMELTEQPFQLERLRHTRHFKIEYYDRYGRLQNSNYELGKNSGKQTFHHWLEGVVRTLGRDFQATRRPVIIHGRYLGELVIRPDPSYEIAEVWDDTLGLLSLVAIFFLSVNVMVYWAVVYALRPVDNIWHALNELELGNLSARLPSFRLPELSRLSEKFNHMAQTLQQSINRNHKLTQKLINLQEEERRSLARDLHDELGQALTAIKMDGINLLEISRQKCPEARESAQAVVEVTQHVMEHIRAMLQRLRPEVLDGLGLYAALGEMLSSWHLRHRNIACVSRLSEDLGELDELTKITAYRVVQECLTNVARHAQARRVEVSVRRTGERHDTLEIIVIDDGIGFAEGAVEGFGVSGMRERVEGLGGEFIIARQPEGGTRIVARLPIQEEK